MYTRIINYPKNKSFFLLGPRGTGKSTWVRKTFPKAGYIDLLNEAQFQELLRDPNHLNAKIQSGDIIIDEIQRLPHLLNEVHRLIETKKYRFILTGSSARKLRKTGVNLLAGRARQVEMHPLTATELGSDFDLRKSLDIGHLPTAYTTDDPKDYLKSYVGTFLRQEVVQEALVRNLPQFSRFLESAAYSQASVLNVLNVASDCGVDRKTAVSYFDLLEDLLVGTRLPVFQKKGKRRVSTHPKFYYFDVGVYKTLRKSGPLDFVEAIEGIALESFIFQEIRATISNLKLEYEMSFWRTSTKQEVDFVLYGPSGFLGIEVKRSQKFRKADLSNLEIFLDDFPKAKGVFLYLGSDEYQFGNIQVLSIEKTLPKLGQVLRS